MTSIPVAICRFSDNNFKRLYLKNERLFVNFWLFFWIVDEIYNVLKTRRVSQPNYYRNYYIRKRCLLKHLKGLASADHSVISVLTGSKHCWNQHGSTIFLFFHEFEINWVVKFWPQSHLKSSESLLTSWLAMTGIPIAKCRFSINKFKRLYLKKEKLFVEFFLHFWNVHEMENIMKKKKSILA